MTSKEPVADSANKSERKNILKDGDPNYNSTRGLFLLNKLFHIVKWLILEKLY